MPSIEDPAQDPSHEIEVLNGTTVRAEGRSYELAAGDAFVAHVDFDGTLRVTNCSPR